MQPADAGAAKRALVLGEYRQTITVVRFQPRRPPARRRALQILKSEVDRVLALLGCNSIAELGPERLLGPDVRRPRGLREHRDLVAHQPVELRTRLLG